MLIRIPIKVHSVDAAGRHINEEAEAIVVSRYGGLIRLGAAPKMGTTLEILNGFSQEVEKFRVVWVGGEAREGRYDVGIELVTTRENFWGIRFPDPARKD